MNNKIVDTFKETKDQIYAILQLTKLKAKGATQKQHSEGIKRAQMHKLNSAPKFYEIWIL